MMKKSKETILSFIRLRSVRVSLLITVSIIILLNVGFRIFFSAYLKADTATSTQDIISHMKGFLEDGILSEEEQVATQQMAISEKALIKLMQNDEVIDFFLPTDTIGTMGMGMGMGMGRSSNTNAVNKRILLAYSDWYYVTETVETQAGQVALEVGRPASAVQTQQAQRFIWMMNIMMVAIAGVSIVVIYLSSQRMAKRISRPIDRMGNSASLMMNRHYDDVVYEDFGILELDELSSQIKQLADRLSKQELIRRRMTGDIAHELRNPLSVLKSHVEAFQDGVFEVNEENLGAVTLEIDRLNQLIDDLGELNDIEAMEVNGIKEEVDLSSVLKSSLERFARIAKNKGIILEQHIDSDCHILGIERQWSRLFDNLIQNALKYTELSGSISVNLEMQQDAYQFTISDTGVGIPEKDLPHIFDRFYRGDPSRNRETGGSGIGLSIVKSIADAYHCMLSVNSREGEGTTILITIPSQDNI